VAKEEMREILREIQSGEFAKEFVLENKANAARLQSTRAALAEHPIEQVGDKLRKMMPWCNKAKLVDKKKNWGVLSCDRAGSRMRKSHPPLAREGWSHVGLTLAATLAVGYAFGWVWSLLPLAAFLFCVQFFRDPHRERPEGDRLVIAPADGKVVMVGVIPNPFGSEKALKISVFMNFFNVHSNKIPCDGEVVETVHHAGKFLNAALDKASTDNERQVTRIRNGSEEIVMVQIAGLIARRIKCYLKQGQRVSAAERFGFIRFGSRVDLYLPPGSSPRASIGDKVKGGLDVVALLPPSESSSDGG